MYTTTELQEAKAYLRDRIRNEQSMSADVERLLYTYAAILLAALYQNSTDGQIEDLIERLIAQLLADCQTLAIDKHDKKDEILPFMLSERNGKTLEDRVRERAKTFYEEVLLVYTAGKLLNKNRTDILVSIRKNMSKPYENPLLKEAIEKQKTGAIPSKYDFTERHYGKGVATSSLVAIDRVLVYAVGESWMRWLWLDAKEKGMAGYYVERGSSYACDICDAHVGIFYPIDNLENMPLYHLHCCCFVVYVKKERL